MNEQKYLSIAAYCEACFDKHGDNYLGVGWTKSQADADVRHQVILDVIKTDLQDRVSLLDFGCGTSQLYDFIRAHQLTNIDYSGLDISERFIRFSQNKYPDINYYQLDVLKDAENLPEFDYVVLSGVFTAKMNQTFDEMIDFFQRVVRWSYSKAKIGIAFNVTSKQVDWERDDLFHLPFDNLATFLTKEVSRHFVIRHDYRLYDYTTYIYR